MHLARTAMSATQPRVVGPTHIIFDLDGTLLDTEALYSTASEIVCSRYGKQHTLALKRLTMGGDTLQNGRLVVETLGLPISAEAYIAQRETELLALLPEVEPMPGAIALLNELSARRVPMAIATSGHREITALKLARHPFLNAAASVVCGDDGRLVHPKPAPDIFLLAAAELGAAPAHCVVLEDSVNGVLAGTRADMHTIALIDPRWGFVAEQFEAAARTISSLHELSADSLGFAPERRLRQRTRQTKTARRW